MKSWFAGSKTKTSEESVDLSTSMLKPNSLLQERLKLKLQLSHQPCTKGALAASLLALYSGEDAEVLRANPADLLEKAQARGILSSESSLYTPVKRAEAVKMACVPYAIEPLALDQLRRTFKDVPPTHWACGIVHAAAKAGKINGYDQKSFDPEAQLGDGANFLAQFQRGGVGFDPTQGAATDQAVRDQQSSPEARVAAANSIIDALNNEAPGSKYAPQGLQDANGNGQQDKGEWYEKTFCNVYAVDYCNKMGVSLKSGIRANDLFDWLQNEGALAGWMCLGKADNVTLQQGQNLANEGRVVLAIGQRKGVSGHVAAIVPEVGASEGTTGLSARTDSRGQYQPVQSEAGGYNQKRTNYGTNWQSSEFVQTAVWVHA